ncbi:MAG TPA: VTT domain-containing protein [Patescibacteria group bacterium]|jgi:uncharacterized membrane protein YdjX (TVP38/TMEM64 family)|nr:VTT domain-containing protein [Patescibacteria group bacterium]
MKKLSKILILLLFCASIVFGVQYIKTHHAIDFYAYAEQIKTYLKDLVICCPLRALSLYITLYIICATTAIPILMPLTLCGGMLFGTLIGGIVAIICSTAGALFSFLLIKKFFLSIMSSKYAVATKKMDAWIGKKGVFSALVILHLLTVVPYVIINTIAAILGVSVPLFVAAALFGSTPVMFIYAFAGAQLTTIQSFHDMLSPTFLVACFLFLCCILIPPFFIPLKKSS